ncbi:DUF3488 and transglutaminase-like domain-containing protein [Bifidobacterium panos]|uniref:Transglutaminase n=1 Tax=Bifidobacterium panos TaxID=2675321 RepID=A0ABX1SXY6_9BIFI|nr:transglutaminase domain-containing protein [Bifidobacterium sp. DSM 109963]NMN01631.1 transglutaminase [Bifidobacterium sp. DSM 109963]
MILSTRTPAATPASGKSGTSWADSAKSAIRLVEKEGRAVSRTTHDSWGRIHSNLVNLSVAAALMLLAVSNLIDVYGDIVGWLFTATPATLLGCLIALAGTKPSLRLWWQLVFLALAQFIIGPIVTMNDTTIGHILPSAQTLSNGWQQTFGSFKYLISIAPPIGTADGSLMALWTIALWGAFLTGLFALAGSGELSLLGALVVFAAFAATALLGTATGWQRAAAGIAATLILIVWLSARCQLLQIERWLSSLTILVLAIALSIGACLLLPQHRTILRNRYEPPISPYDYTSPLSTLRSYVSDHKDDTVLTVRGLPAGTPVRLAVMDRFDGNVWNLSDSAESRDSANYRRVGTTIANETAGKQFTATFTVGEGLTDAWLPLSGSVSSLTFANRKDAGSFYYNTDTSSALYPARTSPGLTYTETGMIPSTPSNEDIDKAEVASISQPQAQDVPGSVGKLATAIAGGESKGGKAARALASRLNSEGWFSHGLEGDYPSLPGHGNYRIDKLLAGTAMVGDSEQYASAMALMARELGLPSRVVLGFTPKDKSGQASDSRTSKEGSQTVVRFTGNDIEAWVEIKLEDYGWVAFHPTPKETKVPDDNQNLTPPNPQTLVRQPPVPLTDPLRDEQQAHGKSSLAGDEASRDVNPFWRQVGFIASRIAIWGSPLWALLLTCAAIALFKAIWLSRARRRGSPRTRITAGWFVLATLARQSGATVRGTRRDQARAISQQLHIDATDLSALSNEADYAAFSGRNMQDEQAEAYWDEVEHMRTRLLASLPKLRRWRAGLSLKGMFTRESFKPWKPSNQQGVKQWLIMMMRPQRFRTSMPTRLFWRK